MRSVIAVPCADMMHTDFVRSLIGLRTVGEVNYIFGQGSLIYDARNQLSAMAVAGGYDRMLWLDSDMTFPSDLMEKLYADLDDGRDVVGGLCFTRRPPIKPAAYARLYNTPNEGGGFTPHADPIVGWGDEPFEVEAVGFAVVALNVSVCEQVQKKYGLPFTPALGYGEDLSFCARARDIGAKIYVDPRIKIGHVGLHTFTEADYVRVATS